MGGMVVNRSVTPRRTRAVDVPLLAGGAAGVAAAKHDAMCRWATSRAAPDTATEEAQGGSALLLLLLPLPLPLLLASVAAGGGCGCSSSKRASARRLNATRCGSCSSSLRLHGMSAGMGGMSVTGYACKAVCCASSPTTQFSCCNPMPTLGGCTASQRLT